MFTSSAFAPLRTCSSATSTAASTSPDSTSDQSAPTPSVRPLPDHHEARVGPDLEGLEPAPPDPRLADGRTASGDSSTAAAIWRTCSGVVPQQPPTTLTSRPRRTRGVSARVGRLLVVLSHRVRQTGVRVAGHVGVGDPRELLEERPHLARAEEQLTPTRSGSACSTEIQNASAVWPERLRPLRSIAVNESQSGTPVRRRRPRRWPPSRSACRRSSPRGAGRRLPRRARSAPRTSPAPGRT